MPGTKSLKLYIVYLVTVITIGIIIIKNSNGNKQYKLFGIMAVTMVLDNSFHSVPRVLALNTTGLESFAVALGTGKFITSITMTIFYVIYTMFGVCAIGYKESKT